MLSEDQSLWQTLAQSRVRGASCSSPHTPAACTPQSSHERYSAHAHATENDQTNTIRYMAATAARVGCQALSAHCGASSAGTQLLVLQSCVLCRRRQATQQQLLSCTAARLSWHSAELSRRAAQPSRRPAGRRRRCQAGRRRRPAQPASRAGCSRAARRPAYPPGCATYARAPLWDPRFLQKVFG